MWLVERTSPVVRSVIRTWWSSASARTRLRALAAPAPRWCMRPARRMVEAFGLAVGLGVAWRSVLLVEAEQREEVLERVAPAGEAGGVDAAVIGQRAHRRAESLDDL